MNPGNASLDRVVTPDVMSDIVSMVMSILAIPPVPTDALLVFPGLGEWWRVRHAVQIWERGDGRALLIAGHNTQERTSVHLDIEYLRNVFGLCRTSGVHIKLSEMGENTLTQSQWVSAMVERLALRSVSLCASAFHLPRAYCVLLRTLLKDGRRIVIIPRPTPAPFGRIIPETECPAWSLVAGEVQRILRYQAQGDVATLAELQAYLAWAWEQPPLSTIAVP